MEEAMEDDGTDFEAALRARLARNADIERQRQEARASFAEFEEQRQAETERREREVAAACKEAHTQLVERLTAVAEQLKGASPEGFVVRLGWTASGEEFIAKISTRLMEPSRSLFIELDRDDDEVLIRWHSDVGNSLGLWRLLEVAPTMLEELVLQVADQDDWRSRTAPPPFPPPGGETSGD